MPKTVFIDGDKSQGILGTKILAAFMNKIFAHRHDGVDSDGSAPLTYAVATGTANALLLALTPALTAHVTGMPIEVKAASANTGACTINIDGLGAKSIIKPDGTALAAGDIKAGAICTIVYDGTSYQLVNSNVYQSNFTGSNQSLAAAGYQKLPGGLILQWGTIPAADGTKAVTFPITFPTACCAVSPGVVGSSANPSDYKVYVSALTTTQFTFSSDGIGLTGGVYLAIGY